MKIGKYLAIARVSLQSSFVYRIDSLLWGTGELIDTLVFLFIWIKIFGEKQAIAGFTLPETVTYLIGAGLIANFISVWVNGDLERDVQDGNLSVILVRPVSYFWARVATNFAEKPLDLIIRLVVYFLVGLAFQNRLIFNRDFPVLCLCGLAIFFAAAINFLISFLVGCLAFWLIRVRGIFAIYRPIRAIFAGGYAPLVFFPGWFQGVASFLPFASTQYFPTLVYLGKVSGGEILRGFLVQLLWIGGLAVLGRSLWRRGLKRYEGVGI